MAECKGFTFVAPGKRDYYSCDTCEQMLFFEDIPTHECSLEVIAKKAASNSLTEKEALKNAVESEQYPGFSYHMTCTHKNKEINLYNCLKCTSTIREEDIFKHKCD